MLAKPIVMGRTLNLSFAAATTVAAGLAASLGWFVAHGTMRIAVALVLLPLVVLMLPRSENRLLMGIAMIVVLPWWLQLGTSQMKVGIVAPVLAMSARLGVGFTQRRAGQGLNFIDLAYCSFVAATVFSFADEGPYTHHAVTGLLLYLLPLGFYVAPRPFGSQAWRPIFWVLFIAGTVGALSVLYEFFVLHRPLFHVSTYFWDATNLYIFRPGGVFGGPPQAAAALSMTSLCGLALIATSTTRRGLLWLCLALSVTGIIVTFTRAGMIGVAVGAVVFVGLWRPAALGRLAFAIATVTLVFVLVVVPQVAKSSWYERGVTRHGTLADRENRWRLAWPLITNSTEHLLVGHGVNSLRIDTTQADLASAPILLQTSPHSQYILTLLQQGFVGLALLLAWLAGAAGKAALAIRKGAHRNDTAFLAACAAAIVSLMIVGFVDDALSAPSSSGIVALLAGLVAVRCTPVTKSAR